MKVVVDQVVCLLYFNHPYTCKLFMQWVGSQMSINQAIYFIAGIFDMLKVTSQPLQNLKTLAVGLFLYVLLTTSMEVK